MTTIGYAVLEVIPSLRNVSAAIEKGTRDLTITPRIDVSDAGRVGQRAGRDVQSGMDSQAHGLRRFLTFDGARSIGQQAGGEVNAGLDSTDIGRGAGSRLASNLTSGAATLGRNVGTLITTGLKTTAIAGGAVAAAGIAGALRAGFTRLTAIDDAKFKLQGLGNDTLKVQAIMDDALAAVKGTAFGLDEAATTAASAVAAGIQPGQQLTDYLKLTADTAAIAGTSLADMGSIFNKVQTSGKAFTGDLNTLSDRGLPVFQWLRDEYKVSGEALSKMVEEGKVDAATFQRVVAAHISGASQTMGTSIRGNLANLKAAYSRFGAEIAGPVLAAAGPFTTAFTGAFDKVTAAIKPYTERITALITPWAQGMADKITAWLDDGGIQKVIDFMGRLVEKAQALSTGDGLSSIGDSVKNIGPALQQAGPALSTFAHAVGDFGKAIVAVGPETLSSVLVPALELLGGALKFVADNASWAVPLIGGLVLAFGGFKAIEQTVAPIVNMLNGAFKIINAPIMLAQTVAIRQQAAAMTQLSVALGVNTAAQAENTVAQNAGAASTIRGRIAAVGSAIAQKAIAVATAAWTGAQWLLNAALDANPIGLIVLAIAGFVAGIVYAYNHSETFRKIVQAAWNGIKVAAEAVVNWFTNTAWPFLKKVWEGIGDGWHWLVTTAGEVWTGIKDRFTSMVDWFRNLPTAISNAARGMWDGLKSGLVAVLNWISDKWNAFADALSFHVPGTDIDVKVPKMPHFVAKEGFAVGGYTGQLPVDRIAGVVHGGEHVIKATSRQTIESSHPGLLDHMNATGRLPGYDQGGQVSGQPKKPAAEGLNPGADYLRTTIMDTWPKITRIGGRRAEDGYGEHSTGNAIDVMIPNYGQAEGKSLGDSVLGFLQKNGGPLRLDGIIWRQTSYGYGGPLTAGKGMGSRGSDTQNHMDHLHVILGKGRGASAAPVPAPTEPLSGTSPASPTTTPIAAEAPSKVDMAQPASTASSSTNIPSSIPGLSSWGLEGLGAGVGKTGSGSDLSLFGKAAGSAVSGQVSSLMGVFGVGDSPGWLQAAGKLVGGISVSSKPKSPEDEAKLYDSGGWLPEGKSMTENRSGAPEAVLTQDYWRIAQDGINVATTMAKGFLGGKKEQPPVVYNIQARDTEDAFIRTQRRERERAAAKLDRF